MGLKGRIRDTDHGYRRFRALIKEGGASVSVGIFAGENGADTDTVNIAFYNEYGTDTIPARPFIASGIDGNRAWLKKELGKAIKAHVEFKMPLLSNLAKVGMVLAGRVKSTGENWTTPPNAPSTIRRKGFNDPLKDTGKMLNSIGFQVFRGKI